MNRGRGNTGHRCGHFHANSNDVKGKDFKKEEKDDHMSLDPLSEQKETKFRKEGKKETET